jgi:hypothetical protein
LSQPGESVACGWLAQPEPPAGARQVALPHECIEDDQQIEIDGLEFMPGDLVRDGPLRV